MSFRKILPLLAGVFAVVVTSGALALTSSSKKIQETLSKYEKTGESTRCIMSRVIRDTDALDDYTLLVKASGGVYLNELNGRCSGLRRQGRYIHRSTEARMCKGDIITVIDGFGNMLGSCGLGDFEKLSELTEAEM